MKPKLNVTRPSAHGWGLGTKLCLRDWGCLGFRSESIGDKNSSCNNQVGNSSAHKDNAS